MDLQDAIKLINHIKIAATGKTSWADLGCGSGLFTKALDTLLQPGSDIYAVDKNITAFNNSFTPLHCTLKKIKADFIKADLAMPLLDGVLMANSLHFVNEKISFLQKTKRMLKPGGALLIVEYDFDEPNPWVPFPVSYTALKALLTKTGFNFTERIYELPSRYHRASIYSLIAALIQG